MGKLIKNHWARLIILTAAAYQIAAAISGIFWPKLFWDFLTTNLDPFVRPIPYLQILNLLFGTLTLCWEWPLPLFTTASNTLIASPSSNHPTRTYNHSSQTHNLPSQNPQHNPSPSSSSSTSSTTNPHLSPITHLLGSMHASIPARLLVYPLSTLAALLLYQGTNAGLYYLIGMGVYFWAFSEGEVVMGTPWGLPKKSGGAGGRRKKGAGRV